MNTQNTKIIGESFFAHMPKEPVLLESDFVRMDKSIIWQCNDLFWKYYTLWEKTYGENFESSLPSGISESHKPEFITACAERFLSRMKKLQQEGQLPETIYVYEQGPGSGIFAKGFLDAIQHKNAEIYKKISYLLVDTSEEILQSCVTFLREHTNNIKLYTLDNFERLAHTFSGKILFARHSNMWDTWPCRLVQVRKSGLSEIYVRAVCEKKFEKFVKEIQTRGLAYALIHYPALWKDFFRSVKLQTRTIPFSKIDREQDPYLEYLQKASDVHRGKIHFCQTCSLKI